MDYKRAQELGMRILDVFKEDVGLGGIVPLLWFKQRKFFPSLCVVVRQLTLHSFLIGLPSEATKFIEMVLMPTVDFGPAVSS